MKTYPHLFAKLFRSPLMLRDIEREVFEQQLLTRMFGQEWKPGIGWQDRTSLESIQPGMRAELGEPGKPKEDWIAFEKDVMAYKARMRLEKIYQRFGDVAVVKIDGVIDKRISEMEMSCYGGVDLADVDTILSMCASDPGIQRIVLDIHSPGGSVVGVHETWQRIKAMQETDKEVHAYVNALACSAGYYLGSAADQISAAPSAIVGSIGVYLAVLDASKWMELEGLNLQMIKAGKWKDTGSQHRPLSEEETEKLQAEVDAMHAQFKAAVTENRDIAPEAMEGQWMTAKDGHEHGLVDELTLATLDEFVAELLAARF